MFGRRRPTHNRILGLVVIVAVTAALGFAVGHQTSPDLSPGPISPQATAASFSPVHLVKSGGIFMADTGITLDDLPPGELPYPYTGHPPPERPTQVDGGYLRNLALGPLGGPTVGLPLHCLRCIPYRRDAGISTLILYRGRYFLDHLLSDFRAEGFFVVHGRRVVFFDDPNCPTSRGVYRWQHGSSQLRLTVINDSCPFDRLRAQDLTASAWTAFDYCLMRIEGLWPGELGCRGRHFHG